MDGIDQLAQALSTTTRSNSINSAAAEAYLQAAENDMPTFYPSLQHIYQSTEYDENTRTLAAITFKNGIDRHWRKTAKNAIPEEQKTHIKSCLFNALTLMPFGVVRQNAIAAAKIARVDFPINWPTLFEDVAGRIAACENSEEPLLRLFYNLNQITKALCSMRMSRAREHFQRVAPGILNYIVKLYTSFSDRWSTSQSDENTFRFVPFMDVAIKIARRLICYGFDLPHRNPECRTFFQKLASDLPGFWTYFTMESGSDSRVRTLTAKLILHVGKFFLELSANPMENFAMNHNFVMMPDSMVLIKTYWTIVKEASLSNLDEIRKVIIQGLTLLRQCVKLTAMPERTLQLLRNDDRAEIQSSLNLLHAELFEDNSVIRIFETLVTSFLVLRAEEIDEWDTNPEQWMTSQDSTHWQYELRPCAEVVCHDLFAEYNKVLTGPLFQALSNSSMNEKESLLAKEALYNALGIAAPYLHSENDFSKLLDTLQIEVQDAQMPSLLKRRIMLLIAQWSKVNCTNAQRALIYQMIGPLLESTNEPGICLTAAFVVERMLDDWDWSADTFRPYCNGFVRSLVSCLSLAEENESKMKILAVLGMICERMETQVSPQIDLILAEIPREWQDCEEQHLLKVALLGLLSRIVASQKEQAVQCYPIVLPLIQYSTNSSNQEHIYLIEEALELWHAVLQSATKSDNQLLQLFGVVFQPDLLPSATENLKKILYIIESSLLLQTKEIASSGYARKLIDDMIGMLPELRSDAQGHFIRVLGIAAQVWNSQCFTESNSWRLLQLFLDSNDNRLESVNLLCLLSRIILADPEKTMHLLTRFPAGDVAVPFIAKLVETFDDIGHAKYRKLCAMALTALTECRNPVVQTPQVTAWIGHIWSDVLAEIQANAGDDTVYWVEDSMLSDGFELAGPEADRRQGLLNLDPVCCTRFKQFVMAHMDLLDQSLLGVDIHSMLA